MILIIRILGEWKKNKAYKKDQRWSSSPVLVRIKGFKSQDRTSKVGLKRSWTMASANKIILSKL